MQLYFYRCCLVLFRYQKTFIWFSRTCVYLEKVVFVTKKLSIVRPGVGKYSLIWPIRGRAETVLNLVWTCLNRVCSVQLLSLNVAYTVFSNPKSGTFVGLWNTFNCVKHGSVYFVICPKQEPKTEGVVLHRVAILGLFSVLNRVRVSNPQWHP